MVRCATVEENQEAKERWFCEMLRAGLDEGLLQPSDILSHATPEILAKHLPAELIARIFHTSLQTGAVMTAERILESVGPHLLARHVPHDVLWGCIVAGAKRAGITDQA